MKHHLRHSKHTSSNLRRSSILSVSATVAIAGHLAWAAPAVAQDVPAVCAESEVNMRLYKTGEELGQIQVDQVWRTLEEGCSNMPALSLAFIQQVGLTQYTLLQNAGGSRTVVCRLTGHLNGLIAGWQQLVSNCADAAWQTPATR